VSQGFVIRSSAVALTVDVPAVAMIAMWKRGLKENLPPALKEREVPSDRKPLEQMTDISF